MRLKNKWESDSKQYRRYHLKQMIHSVIYGLAIGDALGVPVEFNDRDSYQILDMVGYGTYNQPAGTWSDDTSLVLATCDSIREKGKIDPADMQQRFKHWLFEGAYTPDGLTFDVGNATREALTRGHGLSDEYSNGNGSLMRILPLAFTAADPSEIEAISSITHAHATSVEACLLYVNIARRLLKGQQLPEILLGLETSTTYARLQTLAELTEDDIRSSGYVVDTLEAALWCLLTSTSYPETVLKAVNLGDDTDTVAAVAGGLAGIIYGLEGIPDNWLAQLRNKELLESCLF